MPTRNSQSSLRSRAPSRTRRGFTLVEMCLGMLVTSMVFGALAAFSMALSNVWNYTDDSQRAVLSANQATIRVKEIFQSAKGTGYTTNGVSGSAAAVVIWAKDGDTSRSVAADAKAQKSEVQLLRFNETNKTLELYTQPTPTGTDTDITSIINNDTLPAYLMAGVTPIILARNVHHGRMSVTNPRSTTSSPSLIYQFIADSGDQSVLQDGSVAMRMPGVLQ